MSGSDTPPLSRQELLRRLRDNVRWARGEGFTGSAQTIEEAIRQLSDTSEIDTTHQETTHSMFEVVIGLLDSHGWKGRANDLRTIKRQIPDVPVTRSAA